MASCKSSVCVPAWFVKSKNPGTAKPPKNGKPAKNPEDATSMVMRSTAVSYTHLRAHETSAHL
eukprot:5842241-Alexandrium_andersonii.AAC.1